MIIGAFGRAAIRMGMRAALLHGRSGGVGMPQLTVRTKGLKNLLKNVDKEVKQVRKAHDTAIRVEGFRLRKLMKAEVRKGAPGGRQFVPLSHLSRRSYHRGRNEPLRRLSIPISYYVADRDPLQVQVGWTGPRVSRRWKYLAKKLQEGFDTPVTSRMRRSFIRQGGRMSKRSQNRHYFFLRKSTSRFFTPARPIIDPFWRRHEQDAAKNIRHNFRRKLRGERI